MSQMRDNFPSQYHLLGGRNLQLPCIGVGGDKQDFRAQPKCFSWNEAQRFVSSSKLTTLTSDSRCWKHTIQCEPTLYI